MPRELHRGRGGPASAQYLVPLPSGANIVLGSYLTQQYRPTAAARGFMRRLIPTR